jgi:hypothetical protein
MLDESTRGAPGGKVMNNNIKAVGFGTPVTTFISFFQPVIKYVEDDEDKSVYHAIQEIIPCYSSYTGTTETTQIIWKYNCYDKKGELYHTFLDYNSNRENVCTKK